MEHRRAREHGAVLLDRVLEAAARRAPETTALVTDAGRLTSAELRTRIARVDAGLRNHTNAGDRVAILPENRSEYVECCTPRPWTPSPAAPPTSSGGSGSAQWSYPAMA